MFKKLLKRKTDPSTGTADRSGDYPDTRATLENREEAARVALARRHDAQSEVLSYLAGDTSVAVRRSIAANPATPPQADRILAADDDDEVRSELARKIARLIPGLPNDEQTRLRDRTIDVLELLAQDQLPRVRQIVAEEIRNSPHIPHHIVKRLAQDIEAVVAAPILEFSPLLSDEDLLEIIAASRVEGALTAIARRDTLSETVADRISATLDVPAVAALLANPNARIREETLDKIIDNAREIVDWHEPLAMRPDLSIRAIRRIAEFVAASLVDIMVENNGLDSELGHAISMRARKRLQSETLASSAHDAARAEAERLYQDGTLGEAALAEALDIGSNDFVVIGLALLAQMPEAGIERALTARSGKALTAVCWKAGVSMRLALAVQGKLAHLPPDKMVHARGGTEYPFAPAEMQNQIDLLAS